MSMGLPPSSSLATSTPSSVPVVGAGSIPRRPTTKEELHRRNAALIAEMRAHFGQEDMKFDEFKRYSAQFQQGIILPEQYYEGFLRLFGTGARAQILFGELVALLPDVNKQQQLAPFC